MTVKGSTLCNYLNLKCAVLSTAIVIVFTSCIFADAVQYSVGPKDISFHCEDSKDITFTTVNKH